MTPTGKFKNFIGGTLGLFVGMSIVSVIEILIWIVQLVPKMMFKKQAKFKDRKIFRLSWETNPGLQHP